MPARAFVNADVRPMPSGDWQGVSKPWNKTAQGVFWDEGRVLAVGTNSQIRAAARKAGTEPEDLQGRLVLPGFVDAHTHFLHIGVKKTRPDLREATSLEDSLARTRTWLEALPGLHPVIGEGWDESDWPGRPRPTRAMLDQLVADAGQRGRPLVLRRICGHVAVANSAALPAIRKHWDSDDVVDLQTGVLLEAASLYLNEALPESAQALDRAIVEASKACHALGITAVGDYSQAPYRLALQRAAAAGTMTVRVASSLYVQQLQAAVQEGFRTGRESGPWLREGGLKVFHDGSLGARTAALREPYLDAPKELSPDCDDEHKSRHGCVGHAHPNGTLNWGDDDVRDHYRTAHAAGIQIHAHAIGDAAIDQGLDAFEELGTAQTLDAAGSGEPGNAPTRAGQKASQSDSGSSKAPENRQAWNAAPSNLFNPAANPRNPLRHRFEHFEIVHPDQIARAARLGVVASSQPNFVGTWSAKGGMYEERLGARFKVNNRFRSFKQAGIPVAFGSDGMPPGPLLGLAAAVHHPEIAQRLEPLEAVWHYTWAAAWSLHWEHAIGSLQPGHVADLVVVDAENPKDPAQWRIQETVTGGVSRFMRS